MYLNDYDTMTQGQRDQRYVGGAALAIERALGSFLRKPGHLQDHRGKDPVIPSAQTPGSNCKPRQSYRFASQKSYWIMFARPLTCYAVHLEFSDPQSDPQNSMS